MNFASKIKDQKELIQKTLYFSVVRQSVVPEIIFLYPANIQGWSEKVGEGKKTIK